MANDYVVIGTVEVLRPHVEEETIRLHVSRQAVPDRRHFRG